MAKEKETLPEELITSEMVESFISETNDLVDDVENNLLEIETNPEDDKLIDDSFRSIHTVKGNAGFFGFADIEQHCMDIESVLDTIRSKRRKADNEVVSSLLKDIDVLRQQIQNAGNKTETGGPSTDEVSSSDAPAQADGGAEAVEGQRPAEKTETGTAAAAEETPAEAGASAGDKPPPEPDAAGPTEDQPEGRDGEAASDGPETSEPSPAGGGEVEKTAEDAEEESEAAEEEKAEEEKEYKPLGDVLVELGYTSREQIEKALDEQGKKLGELLLEDGTISKEAVEEALKVQKKRGGEQKQDQLSSYKVQRKDIRVDMEKLDRLFDLMGELITAEAMVVNHPELESLDNIDNFSKSASEMSKITRTMQEITMGIRMIPLDGLFNKMRRLVRDLSRKFDKAIDLAISGQDTEMDRSVMEEISDPLVHIIRNAIDHGIEDPEVRASKKKPKEGHIDLNARYEGNEIWITIKDDGAGLNKDKIIAKAEKNGILPPNWQDMPDSELWKLIFQPGFSTADKVSEISGRGVGMDVVRRNIEKLRGKIDVHSVLNEGSSIILKIPLTLAIIDAILLKIGALMYSMPIGDVVEFQKAEEHQVTKTSSGQEVLRLREELLPVIKLHEFFKVKTEKSEIQDGIVIVAQAGGKKVALLSDEIVGYRQIVIKALPEVMGELRAISGCSILGDGSVTLIIDTGSLIREVLE
jgi:two-component system, chemotaxis family, sensor kinase CheA